MAPLPLIPLDLEARATLFSHLVAGIPHSGWHRFFFACLCPFKNGAGNDEDWGAEVRGGGLERRKAWRRAGVKRQQDRQTNPLST